VGRGKRTSTRGLPAVKGRGGTPKQDMGMPQPRNERAKGKRDKGNTEQKGVEVRGGSSSI
jgi:hypothetical protein